MKLKVLPNPYQKSLELHEKWFAKGNPLGRNEEFDLFTYYKNHPVVFNRIGYYLTPDDCWLEFRLHDGTFKAIHYSHDSFRFDLANFIAEEKPFLAEDWIMIRRLLDRGFLKWTDQYRQESYRRHRQDMSRDMKRRLSHRKKRNA